MSDFLFVYSLQILPHLIHYVFPASSSFTLSCWIWICNLFSLVRTLWVCGLRKMKDEVDSPFGVLEDYFNFKSSESETSSSKEPSTIVDSDKLKPGSRWNAFLQLLRVKSKPIATLHPLSVLKLSRRMSSSMRETVIDADSSLHRSPWKIFTHHEIQIATNYFIQGMQYTSGLHFLP